MLTSVERRPARKVAAITSSYLAIQKLSPWPPPDVLKVTGALLAAVPIVFNTKGEGHPTLQTQIMNITINVPGLILIFLLLLMKSNLAHLTGYHLIGVISTSQVFAIRREVK